MERIRSARAAARQVARGQGGGARHIVRLTLPQSGEIATKILRLIDIGLGRHDIAELLGVSQSWVESAETGLQIFWHGPYVDALNAAYGELFEVESNSQGARPQEKTL